MSAFGGKADIERQPNHFQSASLARYDATPDLGGGAMGNPMGIGNRRRFLTILTAALSAPALSRRAFAETWPKAKIIRAVVPFAAGSTIDIIGRIVIDPLSAQLGQTIVVENRGGAGGTIG